MFCLKCGKQLPENARFCPNCGTDQSAVLSRTVSSAAPVQPKRKETKSLRDNLGAAFWVLVGIGLIVWGFWPDKPDEEQSFSEKVEQSEAVENQLPDIEDLVPEGIPIIVDEARLLFKGDSDYTYEEFDRLEQKFDEQLDAALRACAPRVCIMSPFLQSTSVQNFDTLGERYGYPYFWLSSYGPANGGRAMWEGHEIPWIYYDFNYSCDGEQIVRMQAEVDSAVEQYLSLIPENADVWEAAKIVHDELIRRVTYDQSMNGTHCHDIYGALVEGSAVCQGYAYAFSHVMQEWTVRTGRQYHQGINYYPAVISEDHSWNIVGGDATYDENLDVTWDDKDMTDINGEPYILYSYFGLTTEEIKKVDSHESVLGLNRNDDDTVLFDPHYFNYHRHEGYYLDSFDVDAITAIFRKQYDAGANNVLTVKFENQEDYERARTWTDGNEQELWDILGRIGYYDYYYYWLEDELRTISIGLNAPEL